MTINGRTSNDLTAIEHSDPSDPWFHFYWPLPGEVQSVSWWPYDDRNNPDVIAYRAGLPMLPQPTPMPATQPVAQETIVNQSAAPQLPSIRPQNPVYRFILQSGPARFDTGANYAGCGPNSADLCNPKQFDSLYRAVQYAISRGEIPYSVSTPEEVWQVIAGAIAPNVANVIDPQTITPPSGAGSGLISGMSDGMVYVGIGLALLFMFSGRRSG